MPRSRGQSDLTIPPGELHENMGWEAGDVATIIVSKQMHSSRDESVRKVEAFFSTNKGPIFTFRDDSGGADAESDATRHRPAEDCVSRDYNHVHPIRPTALVFRVAATAT